MVEWVADKDRDATRGWLLLAAFFVLPVAKTVLENQYFFFMSRVGLRIRAALMGGLYRKALRTTIEHGAPFGLSSGTVVQMMNADTEFMFQFMPQSHQLWSCLLQVIGTA